MTDRITQAIESKEATTEIWTYMGDRLDSNSQLHNQWMAPDGVDRLVGFKVKAAIGTQYNVTITGEGKYRLGERVGRDDYPPKEWLLEDNVHRTRAAQVKVEKRLAREAGPANDDKLGAMTIREVAAMIGKTISRAERRALAVAVLERLGL